jgi:integrase
LAGRLEACIAKLLFTTEGFRPHGRSLPGVPILLDKSMRLVEPACSWLLHIALVRGRTRSLQTWRTYGEALFDWWQTLEANRWAWDDVGPLEISAYRDRMLGQPSELTRRAYARSTINLRIRTLALFYGWCADHGLTRIFPFGASGQSQAGWRLSSLPAHFNRPYGIRSVNELTVRHMPRLPQWIGRTTLRRLLHGLSSRDRLIIEWALLTGMRRMEVAALTLGAVQARSSGEALPKVRLEITKGGKQRVVYPPEPLVDRTRAYVREERAVCVARARRRGNGFSEPKQLFLSKRGTALTPKQVGTMFSLVARRCGTTARFHALRHTFACTMLRALQRQAQEDADINPLLTLQTLLGHSDLASTAIYLRATGVDIEAVERSVDELYEAVSHE